MANKIKSNKIGSIRIIKDFYKEPITDSTFYSYPPILDKDPEFAAESLTVADSKKYYKVLTDAFTSLAQGDETYTVLKDSFLASFKNFMWFSSFLRKLEELLEIEDTFEIPYELAPKEKKHEILQFQPPMRRGRKGLVTYVNYKILSKDPVDKHRVEYIKKDLELCEFRDGFPGWYLMHETTVYERYNEKTNARVRIDFRHGEFMYFISGASDNWQQIMDVPLEMDHIVSALLFRE